MLAVNGMHENENDNDGRYALWWKTNLFFFLVFFRLLDVVGEGERQMQTWRNPKRADDRHYIEIVVFTKQIFELHTSCCAISDLDFIFGHTVATDKIQFESTEEC